MFQKNLNNLKDLYYFVQVQQSKDLTAQIEIKLLHIKCLQASDSIFN